MKIKKALILLPLLALSVSGCSFLSLNDMNEDDFYNWFVPQSNSKVSTEVDFNNSIIPISQGTENKLKYTYSDFTKKNKYCIDSMPSTGTPKVLVIPLWFSDSAQCIALRDREKVREDITTAYFSEDKNETGWYSVKQYYEEESHGKCVIDGEVTPWLETNKSHRYYDDLDDDTLNEEMEDLINSAVDQWKDTKTEEEFNSFDSDKNGYLDGVVLIYGYSNSSSTNRRSSNGNLWAWTYWIQNENETSSPIANTYSFMSYDFMYSSTRDAIAIDAHTYIHEMGHMFGLQDYYDYNDNMSQNPAGSFSMQDYNIGGHDPHSMLGLGWTTNYIPTESCQMILHPFESSGEIIILKDTTVESVFDEYLILEMYSPTGVNKNDSFNSYQRKYTQGPKTVGIRLWHVDARLIQASNSSGTKYSTQGITNNFDNYTVGYELLNSNTTYSPDYESYCSPLPSCRDYKLLQLIRSGDTDGTRKSQNLAESDLFVAGSEFVFKQYNSYFINNGKFNDGTSCNWNFKVNSITDNAVSISLVKN